MPQNKSQQSAGAGMGATSLQGFSEELLKLCERAYEVERSRKEEMEKKAQYYLVLITGVLGILTLKKGDVFNLGDHAKFSLPAVVQGRVVAVIFLLLLVSILATLFCMMKVLAPRKYDKPYPNNLLTFLYHAPSRFKTEADLIRNQAEEFAWAAEVNFENNLRKSKWLARLSKCLFMILALLAILMVISSI